MAKLVSQCPSCSAQMGIATLECPECGIRISGNFELPTLMRLSAEDQEFVLNFMRAQGVIKEMEKIYGVSYPTIKSRLAAILKTLNLEMVEDKTAARMEVLKALENSEITAEDAVKKLKELR
jgi:hypothetical protein